MMMMMMMITGVAVISGFRVKLIDPWPAGGPFTADNVTSSTRFLGRVSQFLLFIMALCYTMEGFIMDEVFG